MKDHAVLQFNIDRPQLSAMSSCVRIEFHREGKTVEVRAVDPITCAILSRFTVPVAHFREFLA